MSEGVLPAAAPAPVARRRSTSLAARVLGAVGAITLAGIVGRLLALAAAPLLTRALGPVPFGTAALIGTIASLLGGAGGLGLDFSYTRYFLADADDERRAVERFCWRSALLLGCAVSVAGAGLWVWVAAPHTGADPRLAPLVAAFVLLTVLTTFSQARARLLGEYLRMAVAVLVTGVLSTGGTVALALAGWRSAFALVLGTAAGMAAGVAIVGVPRLAELARPSGLEPARRRAVVTLGLPIALTTLLYWAMTSADRWIIAWYLPGPVLGSYAFAATLATVGLVLTTGVVAVWFPEAVRTFEAGLPDAPAVLGRLWSRLVVLLAVAWLAVVMAGGDVLRLLTDARFHGGAAVIPWLAGGVFFYGLAQMAATAMVLRKNQTPQAVCWAVGAVASVALEVALVPRFGAVAAAMAGCAGFALIAGAVLWVSERWLPLQVRWGRLLAALGALLAAGLAGAPAWAGTPLASLALKLPVGMAVAAGVLAWTAPDWARRGLALLRRGGS